MYRLPKCAVRSLSAVVLIALPLTMAMAMETIDAPEPTSVLVTQGMASSKAPPAVAVEPIMVQPAVETGAAVELCCPKPCIKYRHHRRRLKTCCPCDPPIETVLLVKNPNGCECCHVDIPVCIPACCTDAPCIKERCGILGRGIVTYKYCCGFEVKVVFRARGDIMVHCYGS